MAFFVKFTKRAHVLTQTVYTCKRILLSLINAMMQTDCPYLVWKIIPNMAIWIYKKKYKSNSPSFDTKHPLKVLVVLKFKTNYQLNFLGIVIQ